MRKKKQQIPIVVIIMMAIVVPALSQDLWRQPYVFEHLSQEQGLSYNTVTAFAQDQQGFLWIATFNGLNRYDGAEFKIFRQTSGDSSMKTLSQIRILYADRRGEIWAVNFDNTVQRFHPRSEKFSRPIPLEGRSALNFTIGGITEDAKGRLWLTASNGLHRFNTATQAFERVSDNFVYDRNITALGITTLGAAIAYTPKGASPPASERLWIRITGGLVEIDPEAFSANNANNQHSSHLQLYRLTDSTLDAQNLFDGLVRDSSGYLWFSDNAHLFCFDVQSKAVIARYPREIYLRQSGVRNPSLHDFRFRAALCAPDGTLWFGCAYASIVILKYDHHPSRATLTLLKSDEANPLSLNGKTVRTLFADKSGVVWVGGEPFGINKHSPTQYKFILLRHSAFSENTLGNNYVRGICQARDGTLWVATQFGGISRYKPQSGIWTHFRDDTSKTVRDNHYLPVNQVWAIYEDRTGTVWAGTLGKGLFRFDPKRDGFVQSPLLPKVAAVQTITEDRAGNLLLGTRGNVPFQGVFIVPPDRLPSSVQYVSTMQMQSGDYLTGDVLAICEDRLGTLWIGGLRELYTLDRASGKLTNMTDDFIRASGMTLPMVGSVVSAIMEDHEGNVWISSKGAGLARYDRQTNQFIFTNEKNGLPNTSLYATLEDGKGNFWISSDAGLTLWNRQQNTFRTFTTADGLQGREFNRISYFKSANGMMFFGGTNGLNAFHPDSLRFNQTPPPVALTGLSIFTKNMPLDSIITRSEIRSEGKTTNSTLQETITLRHDQNFLTFRFAALDFHVPGNNQYAYMLGGVDKDWLLSGTKREAVYTSLDPGEYTLRVRAANNDGVWNNQGLTLNVVILPPWWQTWWFRGVIVLSGLSAVVLVILIYRRRIQLLQEHRQELLSHIAEKERAEGELQRSEEKFRVLFETSPLSMVLWNFDGYIVQANQAFADLSGYRLQGGLPVNFWHFLGGEANTAPIRYALEQRRAFGPVEHTLFLKNDKKCFVVLYGIAVLHRTPEQAEKQNGDGAPMRIWTVMENITERKQALDAMLRYQLNPHFIFNVLHSVNALMGENQENARDMIVQFSSLLRHTLVASNKQTAPLSDEIEAVHHYLAIEKLRFEEDLEVSINVQPETLTLNVPVFLVQPLVENAIKYGMQTTQGTLHITISSAIEDEELVLEVTNTGAWVEALPNIQNPMPTMAANHNVSTNTTTNVTTKSTDLIKQRSTGIGLENLRNRLVQLYSAGHTLNIRHEDGIVKVRISIALQELFPERK